MEISEAKTRYNELSKEQKIDFLVRFSHTLTIIGRECYDVDGTGVKHPKSLRYINEMQHRILGVAMGPRGKAKDEKHQDWIVDLMLEHENELLKSQSSWAFEQAISGVAARL